MRKTMYKSVLAVIAAGLLSVEWPQQNGRYS